MTYTSRHERTVFDQEAAGTLLQVYQWMDDSGASALTRESAQLADPPEGLRIIARQAARRFARMPGATDEELAGYADEIAKGYWKKFRTDTDGRMESLLNGTPARAVIENDTHRILAEMHTFPVHALIGGRDNAVHHSPPWNEPGALRYEVGDAVVIDTPGLKHHGRKGVVNSVLPAPAASSMRTREHHYYVRVEGVADNVLYSERELRPQSSEGRTVAESLIHDLAGYKPYGRRASTCGKCRKRETFSIGSLPHGWSEAHGNMYCPECAGDEQFHREDRERRMQTFTPEERKRFFGEGRMESLLNGTPARAVIENDATPPRTPRRFPDLPPEPEGRCVYPGSSEYKRLFRAYGYTDPAFYPKEFRQRPNGSWEPVL